MCVCIQFYLHTKGNVNLYLYTRTKAGFNLKQTTGPDGAVAMSSANGLVGTGFVSRYRLQPRAGF